MGNTSTVAAKLLTTDKEKLRTLAADFGLNFNQLMHGVYLCVLRYFDKDSPISYEHEALLNAFGNVFLSLNKDSFFLTGRSQGVREVKKAVLFVGSSERNGLQFLVVTKDGNGRLLENYNQDQLLRELLQAIDGDVLEALERERQVRGYFSLSHTLHDLVLQRAAKPRDEDRETINALFTDQRTLSGEEVNDETYYKRVLNRSEYGYLNTISQPKAERKVEF